MNATPEQRESIILACLPYIDSLARHYAPFSKRWSSEDLSQQAVMYILARLDSIDLEKLTSSLERYCVGIARHEMQRCIYERDSLIPVAWKMRDQAPAVISLDKPIAGTSIPLVDRLIARTPAAPGLNHHTQALHDALHELSPHQQEAVHSQYHLADFEIQEPTKKPRQCRRTSDKKQVREGAYRRLRQNAALRQAVQA